MKSNYFAANFVAVSIVFLSNLSLLAQTSPVPRENQRYYRNEIHQARFPAESRNNFQAVMNKFENLRTQIVGQDDLLDALRGRLIHYLDGWGRHKKEPVVLVVIGVTGVGKTATLEGLSQLGLPVLRLDAQDYENEMAYPGARVASEIHEFHQRHPDVPRIHIFDEIDKVAEIESDGKETTRGFIGALNQILSEGTIQGAYGARKSSMSNEFVVVALNFSPNTLRKIISKITKGKKTALYELNEAELKKLDEHLRGDKSYESIAEILAQSFRTNTVGRMIGDTVVAKTLTNSELEVIGKNMTLRALQDYSYQVRERHSHYMPVDPKELEVSVTPQFVRFVTDEHAFPALGARTVVKMSTTLTGQLIAVGTRALHPKYSDRFVGTRRDQSLVQPRKIEIDFDPKKREGIVKITPYALKNGKRIPQESFTLRVPYKREALGFIIPDSLAARGPNYRESDNQERDRPLTRGQIREARFLTQSVIANGTIVKALNEYIIGHDDLKVVIERAVQRYYAYPPAENPWPSHEIFAGFPGQAKTETVTALAEILELPRVEINLQNFDQPNGAEMLAAELTSKIEKARKATPDGRYVLLLEELDKLNELKLVTGEPRAVPALGLVKDLLSKGYAELAVKGNHGTNTVSVDIRDSLPFVTMNFGIDFFGFMNDPRITTIEDMIEEYENLNAREQTVRKILARLFRPETIDRILKSNFHLMKPLNEKEFRKLVDMRATEVVTNLDEGMATVIDFTKAYEDYLFREAVVPSQGGRRASEVTSDLVSRDVQTALNSLKQVRDLREVPVEFKFDFKPGTGRQKSRVIIYARPALGEDFKFKWPKGYEGRDFKKTAEIEVEEKFPLEIAKKDLSEKRLSVAIHEFGHAFTSVLLGSRFRNVMVTDVDDSIGGAMTHRTGSGLGFPGEDLVARLMISLGARSFERFILSNDPHKTGASLKGTYGAGSDIKSLTKTLFVILYQLGMFPELGIINRNAPYSADAVFEDLPDDQVQKLARIVQMLEDFFLIEVFEKFDRKDLIKKIERLAQRGVMKEQEFYKLLQLPYPGDNAYPIGSDLRIYELFKHSIAQRPESVKIARKKSAKSKELNAQANYKEAVDVFTAAVRSQFKGAPKIASCAEGLKRYVDGNDEASSRTRTHKKRRP